MAVRLQIRNDTAANWTSVNPVLATGELAIERDSKKFKIGDGSTDWNDLTYATQGQQGEQGAKGDTGDSLEFSWNGTKLGVRVEGTTTYTYTDLIGKDLEFSWNGTKLGVRVEGSSSYSYTDLKGDTGGLTNLVDEGTDPDFAGVEYKLIVDSGEAYLEVIKA